MLNNIYRVCKHIWKNFLQNKIKFTDRECAKKWANMRDYYFRKREKLGNNAYVSFTERDYSLAFLEGTEFTKKRFALLL